MRPQESREELRKNISTTTKILRSGQVRRLILPSLGLLFSLAFLTWCVSETIRHTEHHTGITQNPTTLQPNGLLTLAVLTIAVWLWSFSSAEDTHVALGAAATLVISGVIPPKQLFDSLGDDTIWLLLATFILSTGVTTTGLSTRITHRIFQRKIYLRPFFHLTTAILTATTFVIPSTSGRAVLALPIFITMAQKLPRHPRVTLALSLLFPSVILLSAVSSLLGAGAHLITSSILESSGAQGFTFLSWLAFGVPIGIISSHLCTELILILFTRPEDRQEKVNISGENFKDPSHNSSLTRPQKQTICILTLIILLWSTESLHGISPTIVALIGALITTTPKIGITNLGDALKSIPWSLILFMASTLSLSTALIDSGAALWLSSQTLGIFSTWGRVVFIALIIICSTSAHLVIQSRSARSAILIPLIIALAPPAGLDPTGAAFASTAAAGFCHTLTSSAKPVALFSQVEGVPTYNSQDLLRLSIFLAPIIVVLILTFSLFIWPMMGLPIFRK